MNQTKKSPVQGLKARTGDCSLCGGRLKGGSAIRRAVNYSLLLSVSAGMPEIVK